MKAGTDLDQCREASIDDHLPLCGLHDAAQDLQRRAFARAVMTNDAESLTALDFERYILQSPELSLIGEIEIAAKDLSGHRRNQIPQGVIDLSLLEFLIDMFHAERDVSHCDFPLNALCKRRFQILEKDKAPCTKYEAENQTVQVPVQIWRLMAHYTVA